MNVRWLEPAINDVREIFEYLLAQAGEKRALKIVEGIYTRPAMLTRNPEAGPREPSLEEFPDGYRYLVEGNYKIVYRIKNGFIDIVLVWDCRRDPKSLLSILGDE